jgi:hypothetical protein
MKPGGCYTQRDSVTELGFSDERTLTALRPHGRAPVTEPRVTLAAWPRLMDLHITAAYSSIAESTWRDYIADKLIEPVQMPGSTLRDRHGNVIAYAKDRSISKILLLKEDVDRLIDERKGAA